MHAAFAPYVPRLLDEPWDGPRIVAGSVAVCSITGLTALTEQLTGEGAEGDDLVTATINGAFEGIIATAEAQGGDVLFLGGDAMCVLFTGKGRHGRAINAVHAMQDDVAARPAVPGVAVALSMSAGIASGIVHLIICGDEPRQLIAVGPTVTRAVELQASAGPGETRSETVDRSALETHGRPMAWPAIAFLAEPIRDVIESEAAEPAHRAATVGFGIFSGVDRALQRNPGSAADGIAQVVDAVQRAAADYDVTLLGTNVGQDGGRFLLTAGVPLAVEDGEERMIDAARGATKGQPPFALRFGVATGNVFAGDMGGSTRRTYTAIGHTVDLAARLAATASPGEVLTTHRTIDRSATRYAISEWDPLTFKQAQVVPVVVGAELASARGGEGGFAGRSEQRAYLIEQVTLLDQGRGGIVDIVGPAGIGKSRLVTEALRDTNQPIVIIRGEEYRQLIPYGAASRLLRAAMGISDREDPGRAGTLLEAQVHDVAPYLDPWLPLLAEVIDAKVDATPEVDQLDDAFRGDRTHWAVAQLGVWLTRQPIVIRIEDSHWLDAASAKLLSFLLARGAKLPWLVLATRRPGGSGWEPGDELDATRIELEPLAHGASLALLTELRRDNPLSADLAAAVIERSGGNPLFLELLAGAAAPSEGSRDWVEATVARQINRLAPDDRQLMREASVLGRRFSPDFAEEIVGPHEWSGLDEHLEREWDGQLRFRHAIVHEVAYEGLSTSTRRDLHRRVAQALSARSARPELISLHYRRAGAHDEAWAFGYLSGKAAFARGAFDEASALLEQALSSARRVGSISAQDLADATELLGDAYRLGGRLEEADRAYVKSDGRVKHRVDKARLLHKRALIRQQQTQFPESLRMLTRALRVLPARSHPGERAELEVAYAGVRYRQTRYRDTVERAERGIPLAKKARDQRTLGHAYFLRGRAKSRLDPGSGVKDVALALKTFEKLDDHLMQAKVLDSLGLEAYDRGRWTEALEYQQRNEEERDLAGDAVGAARAGHSRALVLLDQGKLDDAELELDRVGLMWRAANFRVGIIESTMNLATVAARRGDTEPALRMLDETLAQFEDIGADHPAVVNRLAQAEAHLLGGDVEAALATADKAIEAAEGVEGVERSLVGLLRVRGVALVWLGSSQEGRAQLLEALQATRRAGGAYEEALLLDSLATLYGDKTAAEQRDIIVQQLDIVKLPPFLTP